MATVLDVVVRSAAAGGILAGAAVTPLVIHNGPPEALLIYPLLAAIPGITVGGVVGGAVALVGALGGRPRQPTRTPGTMLTARSPTRDKVVRRGTGYGALTGAFAGGLLWTQVSFSGAFAIAEVLVPVAIVIGMVVGIAAGPVLGALIWALASPRERPVRTARWVGAASSTLVAATAAGMIGGAARWPHEHALACWITVVVAVALAGAAVGSALFAPVWVELSARRNDAAAAAGTASPGSSPGPGR